MENQLERVMEGEEQLVRRSPFESMASDDPKNAVRHQPGPVGRPQLRSTIESRPIKRPLPSYHAPSRPTAPPFCLMPSPAGRLPCLPPARFAQATAPPTAAPPDRRAGCCP